VTAALETPRAWAAADMNPWAAFSAWAYSSMVYGRLARLLSFLPVSAWSLHVSLAGRSRQKSKRAGRVTAGVRPPSSLDGSLNEPEGPVMLDGEQNLSCPPFDEKRRQASGLIWRRIRYPLFGNWHLLPRSTCSRW